MADEKRTYEENLGTVLIDYDIGSTEVLRGTLKDFKEFIEKHRQNCIEYLAKHTESNDLNMAHVALACDDVLLRAKSSKQAVFMIKVIAKFLENLSNYGWE